MRERGRAGALDRLLGLAAAPPAALAALLLGAGVFAYYVSRLHLGAVWPLTPRGDAAILYGYAHAILARGGYAPAEIFPYSPSAVLMFGALGAGGPALFAALWLLLMAAGLAASIAGALAQERPALKGAWPLFAALALVVANGPIGWDLRNANTNLVYLGLTTAGYALLGRRPTLAGVLIGLGVSLKLYSGLIILWLLVNGPRRGFFGAVASVLLLWLALPALIFGPAGLVRLYAGWQAQIRHISDIAIQAALAAGAAGPPIVTLRKAIADLTGGGFGAAATLRWLYGLWAIWIGALGLYAWRWRTGFPVGAPSRAALADFVVILLAPLPVSPWLEPYHAIPLLAAALLLALEAADAHCTSPSRLAAGLALGVLAFFAVVNTPFALRGFALFAQFLAVVLALAYLRPRLQAAPPNGPPVIDLKRLLPMFPASQPGPAAHDSRPESPAGLIET
ncbi:MAG: DUF2029 domain-containing protein [Caulobacteraceae bacterium]|nr:DUF2029 domain-containing protein [Caulobacteraceae bacterium]